MTDDSTSGVSGEPPGWYADPWERADQRWWNGHEWSDRTRNTATEPERPPEPAIERDGAEHDAARDDTPAEIEEEPDRPGWYPDPRGEADERWWDGEVWTDRTDDIFKSSEKPSWKPYKVIAVVIVLLVAIGLFAGGNGDSSSSRSPGPSIAGSPIEAYLACQDFTERILRAPSTARFPSHRQATITTQGDQWVVEAYVDAENAFGAMLRSEWRCTASRSGDTWTGRSTLLE